MKYINHMLILLAPLLLGSATLAQSGDWQAVKNLSTGTKISVQSEHQFFHNMCYFQRATDDRLFCERVLHGTSRILIPPDAVYERNKIRQVRLEHSDAANIATGAAVGGGVGATVGATVGNESLTREGRVLLLGTGGAMIGGFFGRDFPILHGKVIYRR